MSPSTKHAYLILAHANPAQVSTLLSLIDDERNDIFVHIDAKAPFGPEALEGICKKSKVVFIEPRIKVSWGGASIIRAEIALLKAATATRTYAYLHLLSGQDLPLKTQDEIHAFFDANPDREFFTLWEMAGHTTNRFQRFTLFPEGAGKPALNILNNIVKGLQIALGIKINKNIDFHFASQWFSISGEFASYVVGKEDFLLKTFRHTNTCDEVFMATILFDSPFRERLWDVTVYDHKDLGASKGNLRLIDWTRGESVRHPWIWRADDFDRLANAPEFFARKFDERVDAEIINKIKEHLSK